MTRKKICNLNTPLKIMQLFLTAYFFYWMKKVEKIFVVFVCLMKSNPYNMGT